ncbi:TonB-dependent receptor [Sorangium sp. So ce295]|uniref:TonB-dependent receptor domain-containing protein n=1 Tax=Sorangium sp. So ce295 TaxID=3133295 RepID=UPI003F5F6DA5
MRAKKGEVQEHRESAEAVSILEVARTKRRAADMGEVLNQAQGVSVARAGGLGTSARFSLNGFYNDQIRVFLDGVPLELAGLALGITGVPVNLVERIEIYRGVVPIRFGADALGGAVDLITPKSYYDTGGDASYQVGSFVTYRATVGARYRHEESGFFAAASAFIDSTRNDYPTHAEIPDEATGRPRSATVRRGHDAYGARGASLDVGLIDRAWVKRLTLRAFASHYDKDLQHNVLMSTPYGAVTYGEGLYGATLRYTQPEALWHGLDLDLLASGSRRVTDFRDISSAVYDWEGRVVGGRRRAGEIDGRARNQTIWQESFLGRGLLTWHAGPQRALRLNVSPTFVTSAGVERAKLAPDEPDPLATRRDLFKLVGGLEFDASFLGDRLQNVAFVKGYLMHAASDQVLAGNALVPVTVDALRAGAGDGVRLHLNDWLYAKVSYEAATRLPGADEIFGNGILIQPNPELKPETSHNGNLGLALSRRKNGLGAFSGEVNVFARWAEDFVYLRGGNMYFQHKNVHSVRALGIEGQAGWVSPGSYFSVEASATYQDLRNTSTEGEFAEMAGDRIPNLPWLFGSARARAQLSSVATPGDQLALGWTTRYTHEFFRFWESIARREDKPVIEEQLLHTADLTYVVHGATTVSSTLEVQNLTDAKAHDFYGVQKPGRAFYFKGMIEL